MTDIIIYAAAIVVLLTALIVLAVMDCNRSFREFKVGGNDGND